MNSLYRRTRVLLVSDHPALDTGFGRVIKEIGTGLALSDQFEVAQLAWFPQWANRDRMIPYRIFPTGQVGTIAERQADSYGQVSFDKVVAEFQPDVVLTLGDVHWVDHIARRPRSHKLVGYIPVDCGPIPKSWMRTLAAFDEVVAFGKFGAQQIWAHDPGKLLKIIPHGCDADTFKPLRGKPNPAREAIAGPFKFVVGTVARNTGRKNLPRLLKAFKKFISRYGVCENCETVNFLEPDQRECSCSNCGGNHFAWGPGKDDAFLYLHTVAKDSAGYDLHALIDRLGLKGRVGIPDGMEVGQGVPDDELNLIYNAMDVFTLPTMGEGWGLPIAEAMAAGRPVLVTNYSGHMEFVQDAGSTIDVAEFETSTTHGGEFALVDINDYVMKLDQLYYDSDSFWTKWGRHLMAGGVPEEAKSQFITGDPLRLELGNRARGKMLDYRWNLIVAQWASLLSSLVGTKPTVADMLGMEEM